MTTAFMPVLAEVIPLIQTAITLIGDFRGTASDAHHNAPFQDALTVVSTVMPLVQQFGAGQDVTATDVKAALDNMDQALAALDSELKLRWNAQQQAQVVPGATPGDKFQGRK